MSGNQWSFRSVETEVPRFCLMETEVPRFRSVETVVPYLISWVRDWLLSIVVLKRYPQAIRAPSL